jgi:hypothetical protein
MTFTGADVSVSEVARRILDPVTTISSTFVASDDCARAAGVTNNAATVQAISDMAAQVTLYDSGQLRSRCLVGCIIFSTPRGGPGAADVFILRELPGYFLSKWAGLA